MVMVSVANVVMVWENLVCLFRRVKWFGRNASNPGFRFPSALPISEWRVVGMTSIRSESSDGCVTTVNQMDDY